MGNDNNAKRKARRMRIIKLCVFLAVVGIIVLFTKFRVKSIEVTGNDHYTDEEIIKLVKDHGYISNSLLMTLKGKFFSIDDIPFVDKIKIEYISENKISIVVYEKPMAGCFEHMGEYVYFDKDGIVLETSDEKFDDIPCVTGIDFSSFTLHKRMPIDDEDKFELILKITQLIKKYNLLFEKVEFTKEGEVVLYYQTIKIIIGNDNEIEEKVAELVNILPQLNGKSGILHMENFSLETNSLRFEEEK